MVIEDELVPGVVAWLDGRGETCLTPFKGKTLVADRRSCPADGPDDRSPNLEHVKELFEDLNFCFPQLQWDKLKLNDIYVCQKMESEKRSPTPVILDKTNHGVSNLICVIPGKATMALKIAQDVVDLINCKIAK